MRIRRHAGRMPYDTEMARSGRLGQPVATSALRGRVFTSLRLYQRQAIPPLYVSAKRTHRFRSGKVGLSDCDRMGYARKSCQETVGSFWKTNPPGGGIWVRFARKMGSVGSAQHPELRPSGVGTTRRRLGASQAPRLRRGST
jgi:hypothetical protein